VHYLCCQASLCESPWYLYIVCPLTPLFRTQWLCFHLKFIIILLARTRHLFIMVFIDKFSKFIWIKFDQVELIIYVCLLTQVKAPGVCFSDHYSRSLPHLSIAFNPDSITLWFYWLILIANVIQLVENFSIKLNGFHQNISRL